MIELHFSVKADTLPGDAIFVAGSSQDLGVWNPLLALPLKYKEGTWIGKLANIRIGITVLIQAQK